MMFFCDDKMDIGLYSIYMMIIKRYNVSKEWLILKSKMRLKFKLKFYKDFEKIWDELCKVFNVDEIVKVLFNW